MRNRGNPVLPRLPPSNRKLRGSSLCHWHTGIAAHAAAPAAPHAAVADRSESTPPCCRSNHKEKPWPPRRARSRGRCRPDSLLLHRRVHPRRRASAHVLGGGLGATAYSWV